MNFIKVTSANKDIFKKTHLKALKEGFVDFKPTKWLEQFEKNYDNYFDNIIKNKETELYLLKLIQFILLKKQKVKDMLNEH